MVSRVGSRPTERRGWGKYKQRDVGSMRERATRSISRFDTIFRQGTETFRPKQGENIIRILPPTWDDHQHWGYDIKVHSYVGTANGSYICLKQKSKHCPICEAAEDAMNAGDKELYDSLRASNRVLVWVIERGKESEGAKLWSMSASQDRDISALCLPKGKPLYIDSPEDGYDVIMQRQGQKLTTRYVGTNIDREPSPILEDPREQDKLLKFLEENPIPSMLHYQSADYLQNILSGTAEEKDEDLDGETEEEEKPSPKPGKKRSVREPEPEDEDYAESEEDEEPEDTEDDQGEPEEEPEADEEPGDEEPEPEEAPRKPAAGRTRLGAKDERGAPGRGSWTRPAPTQEDLEEDDTEPPRGRRQTSRNEAPKPIRRGVRR